MSSIAYALTLVSKHKNIQSIFWENGLIKNSIIVDSLGVNALSSIRLENSNNNQKRFDVLPLNLLSAKNFLVVLQVPCDSSVLLASKYRSIESWTLLFLEPFMAKHKHIQFTLRSHPKYSLDKQFRKWICERNINCKLSTCTDFDQELSSNEGIITINSTSSISCFLLNKTVISTGLSSYSNFLNEYNTGVNQIAYCFDATNAHEKELVLKYLEKVKSQSLVNSIPGRNMPKFSNKSFLDFDASLLYN